VLQSVFRRKSIFAMMSVLLLAMLVSLTTLPHIAFAQGSTVSLSPSTGPAGATVTGTGSNWTAGDAILVQWEDGTNLATTTVQSTGKFTVPFTVPSNATQGAHTVTFTDQTARYFIPATFTVGTIDLQTLRIVALQPPTVGYSTTFRAYIRNNGTVASGSFNIQWIVDGTTNLYGGHYSIPAGATDTHDHIWSNLTAGQHTLTFIANYDHGVPETNYNNNKVTITFTPHQPGYAPGNYAGKSATVSVVGYSEPNDYTHRNWCGPGASQVLISAWTSNVPSINTLATEEKTNNSTGTLMVNMVTPINKAIGQGYYSIHYANLNSQADLSNMIGHDILDNHHPLITGILTIYGTNHLNGWKTVVAKHIITIYGFNFTSPTTGYIYYYDTSGTVAGQTLGPGPQTIDYNVFWSLVKQNDVQLS